MGRFINADAFASTGQGILGNNMYAYCLNNPVMMADSTGNFAFCCVLLIALSSCVRKDNKVSGRKNEQAKKLAEDINAYDPSNESAEVVVEANYFSYYKGAVVVKTPFKGSFSFGFIGLSSSDKNIDTLNHEYGHILQYNEMGGFDYFTDIAILSATAAELYNQGKLPHNYFGSSWEADADRRGGVNRTSNNDPWPDGTESLWYLIALFFS